MALGRRYLLADFSNNNNHVDLRQVKDAGVIGFWHKVTEGKTFTDGFWQHRRDTGRAFGLRVGGYHFARPRGGTAAQEDAARFVRMLGPIQRRDLAPVLDLEVSEGMTAGGLEAWARRWMHTVFALTDVWPLFYSYPAFVEGMKPERVIGRGLWLAAYGRNDGQEHPYSVPRPFKKALAHQFTSNARLSGVGGTCDLSSTRKLYPLLAHGLRGI